MLVWGVRILTSHTWIQTLNNLTISLAIGWVDHRIEFNLRIGVSPTTHKTNPSSPEPLWFTPHKKNDIILIKVESSKWNMSPVRIFQVGWNHLVTGFDSKFPQKSCDVFEKKPERKIFQKKLGWIKKFHLKSSHTATNNNNTQQSFTKQPIS